MTSVRVTRGSGLLEGFLARQRERMAQRIIERRNASGYRLLDIGCGCFPFFLSRAAFAERFGLDQHVDAKVAAQLAPEGITLIRHDVEESATLPFRSEFFDVVTMLAVFEHVRQRRLVSLIGEIHRILRPGGLYVLTTPASWTEPVLDLLARVGLISSLEIDEHEGTYDHDRIVEILSLGGFSSSSLERGSFELGMNLWVSATKAAPAEHERVETASSRSAAAHGRELVAS